MKKFSKGFSGRTELCLNVARGLFKGVGIGIIFVLALYASAFAVELLNVTGGYFQKMLLGFFPEARGSFPRLSCGDAMGVFAIWTWHAFFELTSAVVIASGPVGAVYAVASQKQLRDKEAKKRGRDAREAASENK